MKNLCRKLITFVLTIALIFTFSTSALAAPSRNKGNVKYLSEVALIEAASDEEAQNALTELKKEENGGFTDMLALDLNKGGQKQVYLVYKTSTNVDDAITDLAVMNMNGDFSVGNYEQLLSDTMNGYYAVTKDYRTIAAEFAAEYTAGNVNALTAYRQMNYYYLEENGVKTYMGDYMLNFPTTDEGFGNILFKGNLNIIANLRSLLAMGVGNGETTLAARIAESYKKAETDPSVYETAAYLEAAESIKSDLDTMKKDINNLEAEIAEVDKDTTMDADQKKFTKETLENSLTMSQAFLELLKTIPMGETTLGDYIMNTPVIEENKLFPIVAAGSEAEKLLMEYHSLYTLLLYDEIEMSNEALEEALADIEAEFEPISVYHGVQNDLVSGTIGVTGDAEAYSSSTGKSFYDIYGNESTEQSATIYTILGSAGLGTTIAGAAYLGYTAYSIAADNAAKKLALDNALAAANHKVKTFTDGIDALSKSTRPSDIKCVAELQTKLQNAQQEVSKCTDDIANAVYAKMSTGQILLGSGIIVVGLIMMGISIWQLTEIYNKYEISYTDIPDNMVHVVNYEDLDRFINYKNVPAYYYEGGVLKNRENDLNAYDGLQWVSLYYTKNYEAGHCLTSSPDLIATETVKTGYTPIHLFGRSEGYNTNAYCNRENAESVYLAFKYSTNQKSAVTDVPEIVGSLFNNTSTMAISALVGLAAGIIVMAVINKNKKKYTVTKNNEEFK